jgi:glucan endo-1,3-beta-D-glucosidase
MRAAVFATLASTALAYRGFNYGALDLSGAVRDQASYESEFNAAKALPGTNGAFTSARLYTSLQGSTTNPNEAFAAAVNTQTSLLLGIWISGNPNIDTEINAIKAAASQQGSAFTDLVAGISVGSEDAYRVTSLGVASGAGPGVDPQGIANYVNQVRSGLAGTALEGKPIGHVDTYNTYSNSSGWMAPVIEAVDFIGMNAFPYFEDTKPNSIENGNATFWGDYEAVVAQANGKEIWITETGWPTGMSPLPVPSKS